MHPGDQSVPGQGSSGVRLENIAVYDSQVWLDCRQGEGTVAALPHEVRVRLQIPLGGKVRVINPASGAAAVLMALPAQARLLPGGDCAADEGEWHVALAESLREKLGLNEVPAPHRAALPAFNKKYTPVDLESV